MDEYKGLPVLAFETQVAWREWLDGHHQESSGLWLRIFKKASGHPTVTYAEALDEALCYGWIDSTKAAGDADSFLQRFSPRKSRSIWSKVNREHVARLIVAGKMQPAGLAVIEAAKANGQWDAAYDSASSMVLPAEFQAALDAHPEAKAFFESLNKTNQYAFYHRIHTAKRPETRTKKVAWALDMLLRKEKLH
ncbi:MAG TPA: YdeI/OmpD-associated family protein [Stenomitos sp.]